MIIMVVHPLHQNKISHPQILGNVSISLATGGKKIKIKKWIVSSNVNSYDSKIHGGWSGDSEESLS
jgi:hypothetical protein